MPISKSGLGAEVDSFPYIGYNITVMLARSPLLLSDVWHPEATHHLGKCLCPRRRKRKKIKMKTEWTNATKTNLL